MTRMFAALASLVLVFVAPAVLAAPLTADQAARFVASLPDAQALENEFGTEALKNQDLESFLGDDGTFLPYTRGLAILRQEAPEGVRKLGGIVSRHGFSSVESWAQVGDRVLQAYAAVKMGENMPQDAMAGMTAMGPEMLAQLPPQVRSQVEASMKMMNAFKEVSDADKAAVAPVVSQLDQFVEIQAGNQGMR